MTTTVENDFFPFACGQGASVLTQAQYAGMPSLIANGFTAGVAPAIQLNKVWRQSSIMAAVLAQLIVANTGQPAIDDGTTATLQANLQAAIAAISQHGGDGRYSPLAANIQFIQQSQPVTLASHGMIEFNGNAASTITLPDPTQNTPVLTYVWNGSASSQLTLATAAGGFFGPGVPANGATFSIPPGYGAWVCSDSRNYIVLSSCYTKSPPAGDSTALIPNTAWTQTAIANAVTAAIAALNMPQYATGAALASAIAGLNIGQYATNTALANAVAPLAQASRIGSNAGAVLYQAAATQPLSDIGKLVELSGSFTLNTPSFNGVPAGAAMEYINTGNGPVTISGNGASFFYNGAIVGSITLQSGQSVRCVFDGISIVVTGGFGAASIGSNPYQKLPSGVIFQWGAASVASASDTLVTLPVAFPNQLGQVLLGEAYNLGSSVAIYGSWSINTASPKTSFYLRNSSASGNAVSWFAIGN
ncbi:gp53-like domain-containing protein [Chromobacterium subtsugae]|uniref:gp53-like domain-containing protein n=1 Tax=Chromobacterium subtsugae TaxID=251747 RepID=UPI00069A2238|nr:hypothetical protein [Chromobacterium subtsugae]